MCIRVGGYGMTYTIRKPKFDFWPLTSGYRVEKDVDTVLREPCKWVSHTANLIETTVPSTFFQKVVLCLVLYTDKGNF